MADGPQEETACKKCDEDQEVVCEGCMGTGTTECEPCNGSGMVDCKCFKPDEGKVEGGGAVAPTEEVDEAEDNEELGPGGVG